MSMDEGDLVVTVIDGDDVYSLSKAVAFVDRQHTADDGRLGNRQVLSSSCYSCPEIYMYMYGLADIVRYCSQSCTLRVTCSKSSIYSSMAELQEG